MNAGQREEFAQRLRKIVADLRGVDATTQRFATEAKVTDPGDLKMMMLGVHQATATHAAEDIEAVIAVYLTLTPRGRRRS